jgi:hypothetical protein
VQAAALQHYINLKKQHYLHQHPYSTFFSTMKGSLSQFAVCARLSLLLWAAARLCLPVGQVGKAVPAGGEMELQTALLRSTVARVPLLSMVFAEPAEKSALLRHSVDTENELLVHTPTPYGSVLQEAPRPASDLGRALGGLASLITVLEAGRKAHHVVASSSAEPGEAEEAQRARDGHACEVCGRASPGIPSVDCPFCCDVPSWHHGRCCSLRPRHWCWDETVYTRAVNDLGNAEEAQRDGGVAAARVEWGAE